MAQNEVQIVPWHRLKAHLEKKLQEVRSLMDEASGDEMYKLQGEARAYKKLLNLPEALALADAEDERVEKEKKK